MRKTFFTKASPKAAEGIRRAFEATGANVRAFLDPSSGKVTVVVEHPDERKGHRAAA